VRYFSHLDHIVSPTSQARQAAMHRTRAHACLENLKKQNEIIP
jgi:hypothetical protein